MAAPNYSYYTTADYEIIRNADFVFRKGIVYVELGAVADFVGLASQIILANYAKHICNFPDVSVADQYVDGNHIIDILSREHLDAGKSPDELEAESTAEWQALDQAALTEIDAALNYLAEDRTPPEEESDAEEISDGEYSDDE